MLGYGRQQTLIETKDFYMLGLPQGAAQPITRGPQYVRRVGLVIDDQTDCK